MTLRSAQRWLFVVANSSDDTLQASDLHADVSKMSDHTEHCTFAYEIFCKMPLADLFASAFTNSTLDYTCVNLF